MKKPTVVITPMNRSVYREGEKEWHNDSVAFSVYAATDSAGIYSVEIKVNGKTVATDKTGKAVNADFFESQTLKETFTVDTDFNAMDGENNIEAIVTNNYGNMETARVKVFIDKTNPRIIGFNITAENNGILSKILNFLSFGNFSIFAVEVPNASYEPYNTFQPLLAPLKILFRWRHKQCVHPCCISTIVP